MTTPVELDLEKGIDGDDKAICHLMPCRVDHNELEIKAKEYFWPTVRELQKGGDNDQGRKVKHDPALDDASESKDHPILTASFRGRPLQGRRITLPDGFSGHIISKPITGIPKPGAKSRPIAKHFDEFTYWNWDELPKPDDAVVKALEWIQVAKSIHDPV